MVGQGKPADGLTVRSKVCEPYISNEIAMLCVLRCMNIVIITGGPAWTVGIYRIYMYQYVCNCFLVIYVMGRIFDVCVVNCVVSIV